MLEGKALMDKLREQPDIFKVHMRNREYSCAKACYDTVRDVLVFLEADGETMQDFFRRAGGTGRNP